MRYSLPLLALGLGACHPLPVAATVANAQTNQAEVCCSDPSVPIDACDLVFIQHERFRAAWETANQTEATEDVERMQNELVIYTSMVEAVCLYSDAF